MRYKFLIVVLILGSAVTMAQDPDLIVLTEDESGGLGTLGGDILGISGNGRFVAFLSQTPLVAEDTTGRQIYVRDLQTGELELISATPSGVSSVEQQGSVRSDFTNRRAISDDGRYVAFTSSSPDLVPGIDPGPFLWLFHRDRQTQTTRLVSVNNDDEPANQSLDGAFQLDPSGLAVAFSTVASNLDPIAPTGGIFLHRLDSPVGSSVRTQAACRDRDGIPRPASVCQGFSISCGGAIMAFRGAGAVNFVDDETLGFGETYDDYFIGNTIDGNWIRIGAEADVPLPPDNEPRGAPALDCSGTRMAFWTNQTLRLGDTDDTDLYIFDLIARRFTLLEDPVGTSLGPPGGGFFQSTNEVSLSSSGNMIAFSTQRALDPNDTNGLSDVYTLELLPNPIPPYDIQWVSNALNTAGNGDSFQPFAANNGQVAFKSDSDNPPWPPSTANGHLFANSVVLESIFFSGFE